MIKFQVRLIYLLGFFCGHVVWALATQSIRPVVDGLITCGITELVARFFD